MTPETTTIFAIWGAITGTVATIVSIILAIREFAKDKHKILIEMRYSKDDPFWEMSGITNQIYVVLNVLNTGFRPVQIKSAYLLIFEKRKSENMS